ncbi:hypothetical protein EVAR_64494_1 [Eumeta japonica]|uniref:Uncharacterized protein n=1 Tax=Eumeta variegata TaxID=151549 RepID=A0A4C1Z3R5_EUMVA|nr:hypothetical protein EVAR_64494_1 [Eumeta japonica]
MPVTYGRTDGRDETIRVPVLAWNPKKCNRRPGVSMCFIAGHTADSETAVSVNLSERMHHLKNNIFIVQYVNGAAVAWLSVCRLRLSQNLRRIRFESLPPANRAASLELKSESNQNPPRGSLAEYL